MTWKVNGTFTIEYETENEEHADLVMNAFARNQPDEEFYIMALVNPRSDNSNLFNVCRRTWRAA